jgi:hypothetical protein
MLEIAENIMIRKRWLTHPKIGLTLQGKKAVETKT